MMEKNDGKEYVYRGNFIYNVSAEGVASLESVSIPDGRVYCSGTPDEMVWECWNITDYLGNVRSRVRADNGMAIEISDYLPYGIRIEDFSVSYEVGQNRWYYAGKEYQDFGAHEADLIDFGARYYSPSLCRWTTLDPQAGKYLSVSSYNYCNNNPVNFVDPNGMSVYELLSDGTIVLVESNDDKYDVVKANGAEFYVKGNSIMTQLFNSGTCGFPKAEGYSKQMIELFYFLADYSDVEWALHIKETDGGHYFYIGSIKKEDSAGSYDLYMDSKPNASMHSHPKVTPNINDELKSMGIEKLKTNTAQKWIEYDWDNVSNGKTAPLFYVYFPVSGRRYLLNKKGYKHELK